MKKITLNLGDYEQFFKPVEPVKRSYKKTSKGASTKAPKSSSKASSKKAPRKSASNAKGTSIKTPKTSKTKTAKPKKAKKSTKPRRTPEEMAELRQQRFEAHLEREAQKKMREMERDAKNAEREARAILRDAEKAERELNKAYRESVAADREMSKRQRAEEKEFNKRIREEAKAEREQNRRQKTIDAAHKKVEQRFDALHKPGNPNFKNELADLFTEKILMLEKGADFSELDEFLRINTPKTFKESYVDLNRVASISNEENRTLAIKEMFENYIDNTTEFGAAALLKDLDKFESFNYQGMRYASDDEAYAKIYSDITGSKHVSDDVKAIMALMPKNVAVNFYKNYRDLQILANGGYRSFEYDLAAEDYYTKDRNIENFDKSLHAYTKKGSRKEIGGVSLDAKNFLRHIIGNMTDIKKVNEFLKRVESTTSMDLTNMYIRDRRRK